MKKFIFGLLLMVAFILGKAIAQDDVNIDLKDTTQQENKTVTNQGYKSQNEVRKEVFVKYDKFKNATIVENKLHVGGGPFELKDEKNHGTGLSLWVTGVFVGKSIDKTTDVAFILSFTHYGANGWDYLDCHDLSLLVDGKIADFGEATHDGTILDSGAVNEYIQLNLTYGQFLKLVTARTIEGKICNTEFVFGAHHLWLLQNINQLILDQKSP